MHAQGGSKMDMKSLSDIGKDAPIPKYYQIELYLREQIASGKLRPGDKILTEQQLCEKFKVSRSTVQRAISKLVFEGLLTRNYSKGTIVTKPKVTQSLSETLSFTKSILKMNKEITTKILNFKEIQSGKFLSDILEIDNEEHVYLIKRVRYVEGMPVCVEEVYLPVKLVPGMSINFFEENGMNQSIYHILNEKYNIIVEHVKDTISAVLVDERDATLLGVGIKSPALLRKRISYDRQYRPLMFSSGRYIIELHLSL